MIASTIVAAPFEAHLRATIHDLDSIAPLFDEASSGERRRMFRIRAADDHGHRSSAHILASRMYAWRGYQMAGYTQQQADDRVTLVAIDGEDTIGTLSVGFDGRSGLLVEDLFPREVELLRADGQRVCEFTKLAVDSMVRSKRVLASLFHVAYIYAHRLNRYDCLLIEVNPRHVRFYERMLGFEVAGPERMNRRVSAPAVLMQLDFSHAREQIARFGGRSEEFADTERSLYPYFFSPDEETGIVGRLRPAS